MKKLIILAVILAVLMTASPVGAIGGAMKWVSKLTTTPSFQWFNSSQTTGDLMKLTLYDSPLNGGAYIQAYGGTGSTSEWKLGEGGVQTFKGGATIDNNASATVLKLTETTIQVAGILDVTGNATLAGTLAVTGAKNTFSGEVKAAQVTQDKLYWCDDFMEAAAILASTVYSKAHWTGSGTSGTQTIAAAPGGVMNLETTATGNRTSILTFTTANFDAADLPIFETRVKMSNITNTTMDVGMHVDGNDELLFRFDSVTNAANIYLVTEDNNAGEIVTDTTIDLVAGAYITFRIEWTAATTFKVYINGTEVLASHPTNVIRSLATFKPYFYVDNNAAAEAKIFSVDYVKLWQGRDI